LLQKEIEVALCFKLDSERSVEVNANPTADWAQNALT
jgi:accessory colonization factor AcfC